MSFFFLAHLVYTYTYIPPSAAYTNTTMDLKHLSNGQLSRKGV